MQNITDTHSHLCDKVFAEDLAEVLKRAAIVGVTQIIAVSETIEDARHNLLLAEQYPSVYAAAGLYPTYVDFDLAAEMESFIRENRSKLIGIGEVGLDHWKVQDQEQREIQHSIFNSIIDLSIELDLPLNIHSRSAGRQTIECLLEKGAKRVQMHAFDGKAATALPAVEAGYFFSIPASIARSRQKQKLVKRLPLECLLLETDSPVLSPVVGERNEPSNAVIALDVLAELKDVTKEYLSEIIADNFQRLYQKEST